MEYRLLSKCRGELMGLALIWIMLFHSYNLSLHFKVLNLIKGVGFCGVDIFLMLSALGLYTSLVNRPVSPLVFYRRRAERILPTFWLMVGAYSLALLVKGRIPFQTLLWNMSTLYYWFHIEGSFNWYVPALLAFYLLTPPYMALLTSSRFQRRREPLVLVTAVLGVALSQLAIQGGWSHINDFLYRIPIYATGLLMGAYVHEGRRVTRGHAVFWTAALLIAAAGEVWTLGGWGYISQCHLFALAGVPLCLLAAAALAHLPERGVRSFLRMLGKYSLEIYLINVIFTREVGTLSRFFEIGPYHIVYYAICYTLNIALAVLLHKGLAWAQERLGDRLRPNSGVAE